MVLGISAALVTALMLVRIGILAVYGDEDFYLTVTVAGFTVRTFPDDILAKRAKHAKKAQKPQKVKQRKSLKEQLTLPPINKIFPILFDVLDKLRKHITVNTLEVSYFVGGDPFSAAMTCGIMTEVVGIFTPLALKVVKIKKSKITIMPNFCAEQSDLSLKIRVSISMGSLIRIALSALIQFIKARKENQNGKTSTRRSDGGDNAENPRDGRREYYRGHSHTDP